MNPQPPISRQFIRRVMLRGLGLFLAVNIMFAAWQPTSLGKLSAYNHLFPGRTRLPFGEDAARSYNLSLYNLDAMFASHEVSGLKGDTNSLRIFIIGDSSVWGTLLEPGETLTGQLNRLGGKVCGKPARFYNLGYPTISLAKDLLLINRALAYHPDALIWLTTLEAFPNEIQFSSPLAANNQAELAGLLSQLGLEKLSSVPAESGFWEETLIGQRRELADLLRLQLFGVMWAATGIDQDTTAHFTPAQRDFDADASFHGFEPGDDLSSSLAWDVLAGGARLAGKVPILLVNEPILISQGQNSDLRYNLFYPRWSYDAYQEELTSRVNNLGMAYLDTWDLVPAEEFTNSAIHLSPQGEMLLAQRLMSSLAESACLP